MSYIGNTAQNQAYAPAIDYFNGDGVTTAFTLSRPVATVAQMIVVVANVPQNPSSAYTVNGNIITFTSAPPSGSSNIWVEYTSPITQVIAPSPGTVQQSSLAANVCGNAPAFSAYGNAQTIANTTWTKIQFQTKEFDTASAFDNTTNYRFQPLIAGYYQFTSSVYYGSTAAGQTLSLYRNGAEFKRGSLNGGVSGGGTQSIVTALIYLNGSTDYVEVYMYQNSGGSITTNGGANLQYFQAAMVRSA